MANPRLSGLFADRYLIERELGHGATAVVYLAHDNKQNRQIALKVLSRDLAHALGPQRFLREIQLTARLQHPHILPIFDSGEWEGMLFYVMPFVRGESLRDTIDRESQLPIEECVRITCEVADALAHAHAQGIVHRDVKPENIMLSDGHALLADFGIARTLDVHTGERLTSSGLIVGTSAYMSPEQASGEENIDARSDIYSLACVLYEMIAGVQAFTGPNTQSVIAQRFKHTPRPVSTYRPQVPEHIDEVLAKALTISPADRYKDVKKFSNDLSGSTNVIIQDRRRSPLRRLIHERQKAFGFAAAAVLLITAAAVIANPPVQWSLPFARHLALDPTKFAVVPSAGRQNVAARIGRELEKWNGVKIVDPEVIRDALGGKQFQSGEAFDLAKRYGAGRLIRVKSDGSVSTSDVATGEVLNEIGADEVSGSSDSLASAVRKLLRDKDRPHSADGGDGRTTSYAAWSAYGRAHTAMVQHDYQKAQIELISAVTADDNFVPARLWAAQLAEWIQTGARDDWKSDALRAAASSSSLSPRDKLVADGVSALARGAYPEACAAYRQLINADSTDVAGWMGLGECQRLDERVVRSGATASGFRFQTSYEAVNAAFAKATQVDPGAFDLVGFDRMRRIKPVEIGVLRKGADSAGNRFYAYPSLEHDTIAYVPYSAAEFAALPATAIPTRRAAVEKNLAYLLEYTRAWARALPRSANAFEALATILEARGEIDQHGGRDLSASAAIAEGLRFTLYPVQRTRLRASEFRLRLKRSEFVSARMLADSIMKESDVTDRAIVEELVGVAAATGKIAATTRYASQVNYAAPAMVRDIHVQPQVASAATLFLTHAAAGDCSGATERAYQNLETLMASYFSEKEAEMVRPGLESRALSFESPCTGAKSSLLIKQSADRLVKMQQAYAKGDLARVHALFDSVAIQRKSFRPSDLSLDYIYQEAWLKTAIGDTTAAMRQLDETLTALPSLGRGTLRELGGAAALGRAMALRADLAAAQRDRATAMRYGKAVSDLLGEADVELKPLVTRMNRLAQTGR